MSKHTAAEITASFEVLLASGIELNTPQRTMYAETIKTERDELKSELAFERTRRSDLDSAHKAAAAECADVKVQLKSERAKLVEVAEIAEALRMAIATRAVSSASATQKLNNKLAEICVELGTIKGEYADMKVQLASERAKRIEAEAVCEELQLSLTDADNSREELRGICDGLMFVRDRPSTVCGTPAVAQREHASK